MATVMVVALGGVLLLPAGAARDGGRVTRVERGGTIARERPAIPSREIRRRAPVTASRGVHSRAYRASRADRYRYTTRNDSRRVAYRWAPRYPRYPARVYPRTAWYGDPYYNYYQRQRYARVRYASPYYTSYYYNTAPVYQGAYYTVYGDPVAVRVAEGDLPPVAGSLEVALQLALRRLGFYRGPIDGIIGTWTWRAIRAYRRSVGLPVVSQVDAALLRSLGFGY